MFGTTGRQIDFSLTILRLVLGSIFIAHGAQKIFVYGLSGVAGSFGQMGVPGAEVMGPLVALVEFFGGIAIVLGLLTRLAALGTAATMIGAIVLVHLKAGFFNPNGVEFPLSLLAMSLALVVAGAGRLSIDALIARRSEQDAVPASQNRLRSAA